MNALVCDVIVTLIRLRGVIFLVVHGKEPQDHRPSSFFGTLPVEATISMRRTMCEPVSLGGL